MAKQLFKYFLLLNFMLLFGSSHASATSVDMYALQTENSIDAYAGELNFYNKRKKEFFSAMNPFSNSSENKSHPIYLIDTEEVENTVKSSLKNYLKFKNQFTTIFYLPSSLGNLPVIEHSVYRISEEATLPTDHFLYLDLQVIRI